MSYIPTCPRSGLTCPRADCLGTTDPGVCEHWRRLDRHRRNLPPESIRVPPDRTGRIRAGLIAPCLNQAGAETWQLALVEATRDRIDWQGVAVVSDEAAADATMAHRTRSVLPVDFGGDSVRRLAGRCDVLTSWVVEDLEPHLDRIEPRPKLVFCDHFPHDGVYDEAARWCLRSVDHVVGVSELCSPGFPAEFQGRSSIIWNAVDPNRLSPKRSRGEMRTSWRVPADARVAGFYARRAAGKRPDAMVRLVASLPPGWHVVLIGESKFYPEHAGHLDRLIAELPTEAAGRIHLLPPDLAAGDVLNAFDVLVNPSEVESFGLTLAEALWIGVPVVATPCGLAKLHPELIYPIDVDASGGRLAAATLTAFEGGPKAGSREFARARFSPERFGREWVAAIASTAGKDLPLPGLASQAWSFASEIAKYLGAGGGVASGEVRAARVAICRKCPLYLPEADRCSACGCFGPKRALPSATCPEGKWGAES